MWMTRKGTVEASTRGGADASLLSQKLDGCLASEESFPMAARLRLAATPSVEEAIHDLGKFTFFASYLFTTGGRQ